MVCVDGSNFRLEHKHIYYLFSIKVLIFSRYESEMMKCEAVDSLALWEPKAEPMEEEELINLQKFGCLETSTSR